MAKKYALNDRGKERNRGRGRERERERRTPCHREKRRGIRIR